MFEWQEGRMAIAFVGDRQPCSQGLFPGLGWGGKRGLLPLCPKVEKRPWERDFKVWKILRMVLDGSLGMRFTCYVCHFDKVAYNMGGTHREHTILLTRKRVLYFDNKEKVLLPGVCVSLSFSSISSSLWQCFKALEPRVCISPSSSSISTMSSRVAIF